MKLTHLMKLMYLCPLFALAASLALAAPAAHAQSFTFAFSPQTGKTTPGGSADYTGVFTNNTGSDYYITGGTYNGSPLITGFFNGDTVKGDPITGALEVLNGKTGTVSAVYTLAADPSLTPGVYPGSVDFSGETASDYDAFQAGGPDNSAVLGSAPLMLTIPPAAVPEASSVVSLGLLLVLGGAVLSRRRWATPIP